MKPQNYEPALQSRIDALDAYRGNSDAGLYDAALEFIRDTEPLGDDTLLAYGHYVASEACYLFSSLHEHLQEHISAALSHASTANEYSIIGSCYNILGIEALTNGSKILGLDYLLTAVRSIREARDYDLQGVVKSNIAHVYYDLSEYPTALAYFVQAVKDMGCAKGNSRIHQNMMLAYSGAGECSLKLGRLEDAVRYLMEAERQEQQTHSNYNDIIVEKLRMKVAHETGDDALLQRSVRKIIRLVHDCSDMNDLLEDFCDIGTFLTTLGDEGDVRDILGVIAEIEPSFSAPFMNMQASELRIRYYSMTGDTLQCTKEMAEYYEFKKRQDVADAQSMAFYVRLRENMEEQRRREIEILKENRKLQDLANSDALTGLANRYLLEVEMNEAFDQSDRNKTLLGLEILDIDSFKQFNDTYGHQAGDACLVQVADTLKDFCGGHPGTFAARYGGDEFILLYRGYEDGQILAFAEEIRDRIAERSERKTGMRVMISQGIRNSVPKEGNRTWDWLHVADLALYHVKRNGKGAIRLLHSANEI